MKILVKVTTSEGSMVIELDQEKAPLTVDNFLSYVDAKFYDGTIFHRVIDNFMIQGGGYEKGLVEKTTNAPIKNEANNGISNSAYTIAMARTNEPHSASAQFFINVVDNKFLDFKSESAEGYGYCVFGKLTEGTDTVDKIKAASTGTQGFNADVPNEDIVIISASRVT